MEEVKPFLMSSSQSLTTIGDKDAAESRFTEFCKNMPSLDESMCQQAMELFKETLHLMQTSSIGSVMVEESERYWFAFVLYSVIRLSKRNTDNEQKEAVDDGFTLCRILRLAKLNIVDFFKELPQYVIKAETILCSKYGADWQSRLEMKEMQANFVHLILLSQYYKRTYRELFSTSEDKNPAVVSTTDSGIDYQRFGWFLFLALRRHTFGRFKDLVTCVNGLVSVLAILIIHMPTHFRKFNISDESRFARKTDKGVDLIGSLCELHETTEEALRQTLESINKLIVDLLQKTPKSASECTEDTLADISPDGLVYFEDLLEKSSLSSSLSTLEKDYENAVSNKGELEVFANEEDSILGSGSLSGGNVNITGAKRKFESFASPTKSFTSPLSPHRSPASHINGIIGGSSSRVANTPVSAAMTTAKWLRTVISPLPSNPSTELQRFMTSCDRDVTTDVIRRAQIILEATFPSSTVGDRPVATASLMDNIWAEQRRLEACKLYYRVLEAMCRAEVQILHSNNLTSLLTNERFHRCMLACSAELVLATHKTVTMLFPAVLERTGITAFDLSKVIESFIRHEESLPRELKRHLNSLEERLLESMVWEKGSSMYNSLIVARPSLSADITRLGLLAEPMPSLDAIAMHINFKPSGLPVPTSGQKHFIIPGQNGEMRSPKRPSTDFRSVLVERNSFTSPVKDRLLALSNLKSKMAPPPLQSAFASPNRPNPGGGGETCAETGINIFFSKITKLAAVRINGMLERLQLPQQMKENVYRLFQQILNLQTSLFFSHHIDQIILCCFYGVAKISQINLTFRDIICNYRKQPHCKPQVFRTVFIDSSAVRRNGQRAGHEHVDIITFYNEVFVPSVKPFLVELGPIGATPRTDRTPVISNNADNGQCPGSPKISQFPTVPDMSPKKVSPVHNIYVSPMRSSKMDASISHSAKSYYACVGESTHAYQSPSKDLAAINNRLNGPRKVKAALQFDVDVGLVSDSMVASSLYLQNGGTTPKIEKSDS